MWVLKPWWPQRRLCTPAVHSCWSALRVSVLLSCTGVVQVLFLKYASHASQISAAKVLLGGRGRGEGVLSPLAVLASCIIASFARRWCLPCTRTCSR